MTEAKDLHEWLDSKKVPRQNFNGHEYTLTGRVSRFVAGIVEPLEHKLGEALYGKSEFPAWGPLTLDDLIDEVVEKLKENK